MNYTIKTKNMTYTIERRGAQLVSAKDSSGYEYIWGRDPKIWGECSPVLFPLCGRLLGGEYTYRGNTYKMGCHGFFPTSYPEVLSHTENKITLRLKESPDTLAIYPFAFELTITYEAKDTSLSAYTTVKNTGDDILPFMYGAHPGINVPMDEGLTIDDYYIDFGHTALPLYPLNNGPFVKREPTEYTFVGTRQPLSEKWLKDMGTAIFGMKGGNVRLGSDKGKRSVDLEFSDGFEYFCLWKMPMEDATYVCLEPWSGIPSDGITEERFEVRESTVRLCPDEEKDFVYKMKFN